MTLPVPLGQAGGLARPRGLSVRQRHEIERAAAARAYRVQAVSVVAQVALGEVSALSAIEGRLISATPLAEDRLRAVVDAATGVMISHIQRMANE